MRKCEKAIKVMIVTMMIKMTMMMMMTMMVIIKTTMMMIMTLGLSGYHGRGLEAILGECAARGNFIHSLNSKDLERLGLYLLLDNWEYIS